MLRVLFVDDEIIVRLALSTIIKWEDHGYQLAGTVADGVQALQFVEEQPPDIIITDLKMPNMNGLELIHALAERNYSGKIIVLSNHGEYELVREALKSGAVDYLLKVTLQPDDLLQVLAKTSELLSQAQMEREQNLKLANELNEKRMEHKNRLWKDLLQEEEQHLRDVLREANLFGIETEQLAGHLFYVQIDQYEQALANGKIKNKKLLQFSVANIMKEIISNHTAIDLIDLEFGQYAVLLHHTHAKDDEASWPQLAANLIKLVRTYLNLDVSVTISERFSGLRQLREQYASCIHAALATFYRGSGSVILAADTSFDQPFSQNNYADWAAVLKEAVEEDSDQLDGTLASIMKEIEDAMYDPEEVKRSFLILLTELDNLIAKWLKQGENDAAQSSAPGITLTYKQSMTDAQTLEQFHQSIADALRETIAQLQAAKQRICRKEVLQIIDILHEHLNKKITLDMLANAVNLNSNYLCRIFKQDTGKSVFQYMNEMKVNHAVELLKQRDVRVKEVASEVGIDDPFYFNRLFKKMIGVSPSEFRKKVLQHHTK